MMALINWITEPFTHTFMQHALYTSLAVGAVCALLSCFVILKGWSLLGDAISHAVFPGVVLAYWIGLPITLGAFVAGIGCAMSIGYLKNNTRIKEDTLMGIVFSAMFAVGLVIFTKINTEQHLNHILFGNLLGIGTDVLVQTVTISMAVLLIMVLKRKDFLLYCFDPSHARVAGLPTTWLYYGLLVLLSFSIVVAMQAVGVILVVAMLISPGITAFVLTKRFSVMLCIAIISSCVTSVVGVIASYYLDSATGATIVLCQAVAFALALLFSKIRLYKCLLQSFLPSPNKRINSF